MKNKWIAALAAIALSCVSAKAQGPVVNDPANGLTQTYSSGAAIVPGQILKLTANGQVIPVTISDTSSPIGIAASGTNGQGQTLIVSIGGSQSILVDGACTVTQKVQISATTAGYGNCSASPTLGTVGIALTAASATGKVSVQLQIGGGSSSSGGGITQSASLPTSCTATSGPIQLTSTAGYGPIYSCLGGVYQTPGLIGGTVIDATIAPYSVQTGHIVPDASTISTSSTITCPNSDCNFTAGMAGQTIFVTNMTTDISALTSTVICPESTISVVNSAQSVTVAAANDCTSTVTATAMLVWGPLDTAAGTGLQGAWAAAAAVCGTMLLPSGPVLTHAAFGNTTSTACNTRGGYPAYMIAGWGATVTIIVPTPSFPASQCTGGGGSACFWGATGVNVKDVEIFGAGNSALGGTFNGKVGVETYGGTVGNDAYWMNVNLFSWGANTTGFIGSQFNGLSDGNWINVRNDGMGITGLNMVNGAFRSVLNLTQCYVANNGINDIVLNGSNDILRSSGGIYGSLGSSSVGLGAILNTGGVFYSFGDDLPYFSASAEIYAQGGSLTYINGSTLFNPATNAGTSALALVGTAKVWVTNSVISNNAASSNFGAFISSGTKLYSEGGNTFIGGTGTGAAISVQSGGAFQSDPTDLYTSGVITSVLPACSESAGNGTCAALTGSTNEKGVIRITAGTTTLLNPSFLMTFAGAFSGPSAQNPSCTFNVQNTGTGSWVTAAPSSGGLPAPTAISTASATVGITVTVNAVSASTYDVAYLCSAK